MSSYGVLLPNFDPLRVADRYPITDAARLAEALEFDSIWCGDHLKCPAPGLEAMACLAAAAAVTERVALGTCVMLLGLRQPAWAAKQIATLQHLSGNRLRLGVGVGGEFRQEYDAADVPWARRGARLDLALEQLPTYLTPGTENSLLPSAPMPPVLIGGRSDRAAERAARFGDAWLPMWVSPETLAQRGERLAELAEQAGRPTPRLALLVLAHVDENRTRAREQADAHLRGQYAMGVERVERWTALGGVQEVAEFLDAYVQVGVDELLLLPMGERPLEQIERLAESVSLMRTRAEAL